MPSYEQLIESVHERLDYGKFYIHCGMTPIGDPDKDGWQNGLSCFAPSKQMRINIIQGTFEDKFTNSAGDIYTFLLRLRKLTDCRESRIRCLQELCTFCNLDNVFEQSREGANESVQFLHPAGQYMLDQFHMTLKYAEHQKALLKNFGIRLFTAQHYQMGWIAPGKMQRDDGAFAIPIPEPDGKIRTFRLANLDQSLTWPPKSIKLNSGRVVRDLPTEPRMFGADEMIRDDWPHVIICFSEIDRIVLMQNRTDKDAGAVSLTDKCWRAEWGDFLRNRNVSIHIPWNAKRFPEHNIAPVLDRLRADKKLGFIKLFKVPQSGLEGDRTLADWFRAGGNWATLNSIIEATPDYKPESTKEDAHVLSNILKIDNPKYMDAFVQVHLKFFTADGPVHLSPAEFKVTYCARIERAHAGPNEPSACLRCEGVDFKIEPNRIEHLECCRKSDNKVRLICLGICCPFDEPAKISVTKQFSWRAAMAYHPDEPAPKSAGFNSRTRAVYVMVPEGDGGFKPDVEYIASGWVKKDPRTQRPVLMAETLRLAE